MIYVEFLYIASQRTAHVIAKMRCGAVMILTKPYTAPHMWPQKWGTVQLWFLLNRIVNCSAKNGLKPHHTALWTPLIAGTAKENS